MTKPLTILVQTIDAVGHMNACIGVAEVLRESGHRIVFPVGEQSNGKLSSYGFEEVLISVQDRALDISEEVFKVVVGSLVELPLLEDKLDFLFNKFFYKIVQNAKSEDMLIENIVNKYKPDVIIVDNFFLHPSILKSGIPWVFLCSANPLSIIMNENLPPPCFGLSVNSNRSEWSGYEIKLIELMKNLHEKYNEWLREYGLKEIPDSSFYYTSPYLNIYDYPKEIDYTNEVSLPPNVHGFDNFMRSEKTEEFVLPEQLRNKSGKLIYLSMGSVGNYSVKLMKHLVSILSKSAHRFIISTGPFHDQYELADNMWGQIFVPQTKVLPLVDLFITHGGNNSLTEAFYFGKPMIALPLFGDQPDNAQRLEDTGYGIRLDALNCSESELLEAIEKLINDSELKLKLAKISERIQKSRSLSNVVKLVESLVK